LVYDALRQSSTWTNPPAKIFSFQKSIFVVARQLRQAGLCLNFYSPIEELIEN
jgi:hypothetical protein